MIGDPASAPPRPDLTFLRHRSRARPVGSAVAEFINGDGPHPPHVAHGHQPPATAVPAAAPPPSAPPPSAPPARPRPSAAPVSGSLDLSEPAGPPAQAPPVPRPAPPSTAASLASLDLSSAAPAAPAAPAAAGSAVHRDRRVRAGEHHLLGLAAPTVTLTRVQSGVGQLEIEAVCSPAVGDLRIGAAYQLRAGVSSTVQYADGNRFAPSSRRPLIVAGRNEYEYLHLDLRQSPDLERLAVYAFSESRAELRWGGTLVIATFGGSRIELPLETLHPGRVAVLLSLYNLDGEFVIRAEMETIFEGDVREAVRAYGYDRITWRDDRSPVD